MALFKKLILIYPIQKWIDWLIGLKNEVRLCLETDWESLLCTTDNKQLEIISLPVMT